MLEELHEEGMEKLQRIPSRYTPLRPHLLGAFRVLATVRLELRGDLELEFEAKLRDCDLELLTVTSLTRHVESALLPWLTLLPDVATREMCDDMREIRKEIETIGSDRLEEQFPSVSARETMEIAEHVCEELEDALKRLVWESPVHPSASVVRQWDEWQRECERLQSFIRFFSVFNLSIWRVCLSTEG